MTVLGKHIDRRRLFIFVLIFAILSLFVISTGQVYAAGVGDIDIEMTDDGEIVISSSEDAIDFSDPSAGSAWSQLYSKYKALIVGCSGIATLTMLLVFIWLFTKLATTSSNPTERTKTLIGILFTGLATAGLGSITIWFGFFYNAI